MAAGGVGLGQWRLGGVGPGSISHKSAHLPVPMQALATVITGAQLLAWVTDTRNFAAPVPDVAVVVFDVESQVAVVGRAVTDARGVATVDISRARGRLHIVAQQPGEIAHTQAYKPYSGTQWPTTADLVLGRRLHRPGETVHVKGFMARYADDGSALPVSAACARASGEDLWLELDLGRGAAVRQLVDCGSQFGTWSAALPLPANATVGHKSLRLRSGDSNDPNPWVARTLAHATLLVSDPRVPTGTLELRSAERVLLRAVSALPLTVVTRAGTGERARGTRVTLRWRIRGRLETEEGDVEPPDESDAEAGYA